MTAINVIAGAGGKREKQKGRGSVKGGVRAAAGCAKG